MQAQQGANTVADKVANNEVANNTLANNKVANCKFQSAPLQRHMPYI